MSAPPTSQEGFAAFASVIDVYEHRIDHACRAVASHVPAFFKSFPSSGGTVLDNACGTGAASEKFLKKFPTASILRLMLCHQWYRDSWPSSQRSLMHRPSALQTTPSMGASPTLASSFSQILLEIQDQLKPANPLTELPLMEPWCDSAFVEEILKEGGFKHVDFSVIEEGLWGKDKEDFKLVLLENLGTLTSRNWTEEERAQLPAYISKIVDEQQDKFCITDAAKVGVRMEAWVAVATK
ncbi:hypothetical protein K458DRAFT_425315 [Lentithecium fluviatile CBS 122367]|uniref:S-adenosyl-L-methionine-dependent methyltransferase n=1 Tax=Lentithecium fluviatile CBS 122367 TaxID=1168545 RepID=A0A6G1ICH0_9PLEO|nr:hypothetical protein K458DRAFT_425315 [Lentithecium fluviatile CBS 122367]